MKPPQIVSATQAQLDELVMRAKTGTAFTVEQSVLLEQVLGTFFYVMQTLHNAKTSIKRLNKMLFGSGTESSANVLKEGVLKEGVLKEETGQGGVPQDQAMGAAGLVPPNTKLKTKPPPPGHGRIGAQAYRDAPVVEVAVAELQAGDACPECTTGRVYDSPPRTIVKVIGQPPLAATVYKLQRLRCRLCDSVYTGAMPAGLGAGKYDHSCASMLALLRNVAAEDMLPCSSGTAGYRPCAPIDTT